MDGTLTVNSLRAASEKVSAKMEACQDELNALDGQLGDGDLGVTLFNGFRSVRSTAADLPDDIGMALMKCAQAITKSGGSSYATLLATGLMAAAKDARGQSQVPLSTIPSLLESALAKMADRGKSALGDKTVLDALKAAADGASSASGPTEMLASAIVSVDARIEEMRQQPCRQGRARIFADKSVGMDDPGMVGFKRILEGLS